MRVLYVLWIAILDEIWFCSYFLPVYGLSSHFLVSFLTYRVVHIKPSAIIDYSSDFLNLVHLSPEGSAPVACDSLSSISRLWFALRALSLLMNLRRALFSDCLTFCLLLGLSRDFLLLTCWARNKNKIWFCLYLHFYIIGMFTSSFIHFYLYFIEIKESP